jgi:hypothetical protein
LNWQILEGRGDSLNEIIYSSLLDTLKKTTKIPVRIFGVPNGIRT